MVAGGGMAMTPLLRFVYATLAMRRHWEDKGGSAGPARGGGGDEAAQAPVVRPPCEAPTATRTIEVDGFPFQATRMEEDEAVGVFVPVLEVVLAAQMAVAGGGDLDDSIVKLLGELCEMAKSVGAFADLVNVLTTMLLDVGDAKDGALVHGVSDVLLQLCFEMRRSPPSREVSFAPTIYYDEVLAQIEETLSALFEVAAADDLAAHVGVRCLADTHAVIVSHFENLYMNYRGGIVCSHRGPKHGLYCGYYIHPIS